MTPRLAVLRHVLAFSCAALVLSAVGVSAHPMSHSSSRLEVAGRDVTVTFTVDLLELGSVDRNGDGLVGFEELEASIARVYAVIREHFSLRAPEPPSGVTLDRYEVIEDGHIGRLFLTYRFPREPGALTIASTLDRVMPPQHRHLSAVIRDGAVQEAVLDAGAREVVLPVTGRSWLRTVWRFARLGVEHIVTGYDHLAFLVCLMLGTRSVRSVVLVVTSFTLAHSITLALATFDLVRLPSQLIESLIALSIAYVAAENLLGREAVARHKVTFGFGLIHGFGFSNVLREMELPQANLAASLFSFNAGVEAGQIAFVLLLFPLTRRLHSGHGATARAAVSLAVFGLAVFWFVERVMPS
jgi:hypothetical protein